MFSTTPAIKFVFVQMHCDIECFEMTLPFFADKSKQVLIMY